MNILFFPTSIWSVRLQRNTGVNNDWCFIRDLFWLIIYAFFLNVNEHFFLIACKHLYSDCWPDFPYAYHFFLTSVKCMDFCKAKIIEIRKLILDVQQKHCFWHLAVNIFCFNENLLNWFLFLLSYFMLHCLAKALTNSFSCVPYRNIFSWFMISC